MIIHYESVVSIAFPLLFTKDFLLQLSTICLQCIRFHVHYSFCCVY